MVFEKFKGYGFVHHRALNDHPALEAGLELVKNHPDRTHIFEGDICWDFSDGNQLFYFRHPSYVIDTLSARQIIQGLKKHELVGLDHLQPIRPTPAFLVIELKVGRGQNGRADWKLALSKLVEHLEQHFSGRYWIDGFSLPMLRYVKQLNPNTPVTLHTEFVYRGHVLVGAPEWPPVRLRKISSLHDIDGIAIRRRGSPTFMTEACADVREAGKVLVVSRLHTLKEFEYSKLWQAAAGYMHWNFRELLDLNDSIDRKMTAKATHS